VAVNAEFAARGSTRVFVSDLSETGVFVHTPEPLPIGTRVELRFTVLIDDPVVLEGEGAVVRVQQAPPGMGVRFDRLSPEVVLRIHDVVRRQRPIDLGTPHATGERAPVHPGRTLAAGNFSARPMGIAAPDDARTMRLPALTRSQVGDGDGDGGLAVHDDDDDERTKVTHRAPATELRGRTAEVDEGAVTRVRLRPVGLPVADDDDDAPFVDAEDDDPNG
jgi:hypothetical protein